MPNPFHYRATLQRLARLSAPPHPPHVCVVAAIALATEFSPANPRHQLVQRLLQAAHPYEFARHQLRDLYDRPKSVEPVEPVEAAPEPAPVRLPDQEAPEDDDDPW